MWKPGFWLVPAGFYVRGTLASCLNSPVMATSLWAQNSHGHLTLETEFWQRVSGGGWDVNPLPLHFQDLWFPLMFVLTVCSLYEGCSHGWMSQSTRALMALPGLSLRKLVSATPLPKDAVLKVLSCESSPGPAAPRDQHGHRFLRLWRGRWLSLHICSHSPADLSPGTDQTQGRDSEQQDLGCLLPFEPTTPSRPKLQMALITIFAHSSTHLFTFYFFICFAFEPWNFLIYFQYELLMWYMLCSFSLG